MMALVNGILAIMAFVAIFALAIAWFCGVFFRLSDIAAAANRIVTTLDVIAKKQKENQK